MLNEKHQLKLTDFGSAVRRVTSNKSSVSACSGLSGISHISTVSNVSNVSNISNPNTNSMIESTNNDGKEDQVEDDLVGSECYVAPEMIRS